MMNVDDDIIIVINVGILRDVEFGWGSIVHVEFGLS